MPIYTINKAIKDNRASTSMYSESAGTGESIVGIYLNPTGFVMSEEMRMRKDIIDVCLTSIRETKAMFNIQEQSIRRVAGAFNNMHKTIAKAMQGHMTDDRIATDLSPYYVQLQDTIKEIIQNTEFNRQKLLDAGAGVKINKGNVTKLQHKEYDTTTAKTSTAEKVTGLNDVDITFNGQNTKVKIDTNNSTTFIEGGNVSAKQNGQDVDVTIKNATIRVASAKLSDSGGNNIFTARNGDVLIQNVDIAISKATISGQNVTGGNVKIEGPIDPSTGKPANITNANIAFENIGQDAIAVTGTSAQAPALKSIDVDDVKDVQVTTGGSNASCQVDFTAGADLVRSKVSFEFPNFNLENGDAGQLNVISTLNGIEYVGDAPNNAPKNLTKLQSIKDARLDAPVIEKLMDHTLVKLCELGAQQNHIQDIEGRLANTSDQLGSAYSAIRDADLPDVLTNLSLAESRSKVAISGSCCNDT